MCADQAPWAVSDNFAYGFAAVTIEGGSEADWSCACYNLTFTFGSASGKTMIFQAMDSDFGEATGRNHFVLAVGGEAVCGDCMY